MAGFTGIQGDTGGIGVPPLFEDYTVENDSIYIRTESSTYLIANSILQTIRVIPFEDIPILLETDYYKELANIILQNPEIPPTRFFLETIPSDVYGWPSDVYGWNLREHGYEKVIQYKIEGSSLYILPVLFAHTFWLKLALEVVNLIPIDRLGEVSELNSLEGHMAELRMKALHHETKLEMSIVSFFEVSKYK